MNKKHTQNNSNRRYTYFGYLVAELVGRVQELLLLELVLLLDELQLVLELLLVALERADLAAQLLHALRGHYAAAVGHHVLAEYLVEQPMVEVKARRAHVSHAHALVDAVVLGRLDGVVGGRVRVQLVGGGRARRRQRRRVQRVEHVAVGECVRARLELVSFDFSVL